MPLLEAEGLSARFDSGGWLARLLGKSTGVLAVDRVSLSIRTGEVVGLVGESGCGKSTLGRLLLRLLPARTGTLRFGGGGHRAQGPTRLSAAAPRSCSRIPTRRSTRARPSAQSWGAPCAGSTWPRRHAAVAAEVDRLLDLVRLPRSYAERYPHQLSGGEKQRVGIARALASRPEFLVCDEAVSALDVSVQAAVLNLLRDLRDELGVAYLFISHDIGVIAHIADRVAVMYHGTIVEEGPVEDVLHPPYHPYTELLLSSVPLIGKRRAAPAPTPPRGSTAPRAAASSPPAVRARSARSATASRRRCSRPGPAMPFFVISPCRELAAVPHWLGPSVR